eukprot:10532344-Karenia_brevis.AAC.1
MSGWDSERHDHCHDAVLPSTPETLSMNCITPPSEGHPSYQQRGEPYGLSRALETRCHSDSFECCQP